MEPLASFHCGMETNGKKFKLICVVFKWMHTHTYYVKHIYGYVYMHECFLNHTHTHIYSHIHLISSTPTCTFRLTNALRDEYTYIICEAYIGLSIYARVCVF
jgi:hypothetical protein